MYKLQTLLRNSGLTGTTFTAICNAYGIEITQSTISRALKAEKFTSHELDQTLRPVVLGIEDLVQRALPFRVAFDDVQNVKFLMDLVKDGHQLLVEIMLAPSHSNNSCS